MFSSPSYRVLLQSFFPQKISLLPKIVTEANAYVKKMKKTTTTLLWRIMQSWSSTALWNVQVSPVWFASRYYGYEDISTTKFNNLKVKRVKSNLKYTESKLVNKATEEGRNTKKATIIQVSRRKSITLKGNTQRGITQRGNTQKGITQKRSAQRGITRKGIAKKGNLQKGHHVRSLLRIQAWI